MRAMRMQTEVAVSNSSEAKARAEANFKRKEEQARESANAWTEYQAQFRGVDEKIARLKALRLAKEAAEAAAKGKKETQAPFRALGGTGTHARSFRPTFSRTSDRTRRDRQLTPAPQF
jgi:hypothetical protein